MFAIGAFCNSSKRIEIVVMPAKAGIQKLISLHNTGFPIKTSGMTD